MIKSYAEHLKALQTIADLIQPWEKVVLDITHEELCDLISKMIIMQDKWTFAVAELKRVKSLLRPG